MGEIYINHRIHDAIDRIERHSPYLRTLLAKHPDVADDFDPEPAESLAVVPGLDNVKEIGSALRVAKQRMALRIALGDLSGLVPLEATTRALSHFADQALDAAINAAIAERYPGAGAAGLIALALGKHGSEELNYSSDIDPIFIFDPDQLPHSSREEPVEAAARIVRRIVELLQARDGDGYVFRVDLRLRPSPEATPPALPLAAAISYYESSALPWERAAFIRARAAAGDIALGQAFLSTIRPFVWRRSLDYGAIKEIHSISHRIRSHHAQGQHLGPGYDLKKGRGGIREVEFYAQIHQLIYGGREPALRAPATLDALSVLAQADRIDPDDAAVLERAYRLYRTIEHRLQMVDDRQTHRLPRDAGELDNVARLHGLNGGDDLLALLAEPVDRVGAIYDALDETGSRPRVAADEQGLAETLRRAGFDEPEPLVRRISGWRDGRARSLRTPVAREAMEAMLPVLIEQFGKAPDPSLALARFDDLVTRLPTAINLFRLIEARPGLGRALADILSHAPALADAITRRPDLLDGLIDATALKPPPSIEDLVEEFSAREAGDDYQLVLERVRQRVGERRFALGVQIVEATSDPIDVAEGYARVAEAALRTLVAATIAEFEEDFGRVPRSELVILALGRLGGGALTYASDLDLIYLFTGDFRAESNGRKPIGATAYFNRLAQRVTAALSVPTPAGALYEVDTRLRPSGNQGPLVISMESFALYQREQAWTWEHMALTRARPVFSSVAARDEVARIIEDVLRRPRDEAQLRADVVKMRAEILKHKPPASSFDVKLAPGGLIDCEFAVHTLQLSRHVGLDPRLRAAIRSLAEAGLIDPRIEQAHALLTRMLVTQRLVSPNSTEPPEASKPLVARACRKQDWAALIEAVEQGKAIIAGEWRRVADGPASE